MAAAFTAKPQTKIIARLKKDISEAKNAKQKLSALFALCDQGYSLHADTLMKYAYAAEKMALQENEMQSAIKAMYYKSAALTNKGLIDSSLSVAEKCLALLHTGPSDFQLEANLLNQKGRCYIRMNHYKEAIEMGYRVIANGEKINDMLQQVRGKTLIGWAYLEMGQPREALKWHLKALNTTSDSSILQGYGILFANLATNYDALKKLDSAFYYVKKAVAYSRKSENLFSLSNSLAIQSSLHVSAGEPALSEPVLKEVVEIRKLIGDPFYIASDLAQLGYYYAHHGQPEKGIAACNEGIALARKYNLNTKLFFLYGSLADNYQAMGNMDKYSEVMNTIIRMKDSVYAKNSANSIAELNTKYELQKKENTIIKQELDIVAKNYWLYGGLVFVIFSAVVAAIIFFNYRRRQRMKMEIALAEEKRLSAESVKEAEENERRRIAADLHDNLGAYAASIVANLDTISRQQQFNNTAVAALRELHSNSQSIVSQLGDTIWALKRRALSLTSISDRIKLIIQKVQPSHEQIKIDVEENIEKDFLLSPSQGFNLFQIIQEALINAIKHSNCTEVKIIIHASDLWQIIIADNGTGIKTTALAKTGGNGISNMQARAKDAGFLLAWRRNEPSGTKVIVTPTTN